MTRMAFGGTLFACLRVDIGVHLIHVHVYVCNCIYKNVQTQILDVRIHECILFSHTNRDGAECLQLFQLL